MAGAAVARCATVLGGRAILAGVDGTGISGISETVIV
jgi:hypothetical protein